MFVCFLLASLVIFLLLLFYSFLCLKGGNVSSAGWQVTLCDPLWHVSFCNGEASSKLLYSVYLYLTFALSFLYYVALLYKACARCSEVCLSVCLFVTTESHTKKQLNWHRCRLHGKADSRGSYEPRFKRARTSAPSSEYGWIRIRSNDSCAAAMRPYVKLLWPLVAVHVVKSLEFRWPSFPSPMMSS